MNVEAENSLQTPFDLGDVNPEITLLEGTAVLKKGRNSLTLDRSKLFVSSRPKMELMFEAEGESADPGWFDRAFDEWTPRRIEFPAHHARGQLYLGGTQVGGEFISRPFQLTAEGRVRDLLIGKAKRLKSATFHLPNFVEYIGTWITDGSRSWRGRIVLDDGHYRITVDQRRDLNELKKRLRKECGYALTHVCRLDKSGDRFSTVEAKDLIESLHWFFSFVTGEWTSPCLIVGEPARRGSEWQHLMIGRLDRWRGSFTWCDQTQPESMREAYRGYRALWKQPQWQQGLRTAVGLYVTSNRPNPVEVAIIAAQSGLELLGWLTFVETNRVTSNDWRSQLPAHKKIRKLLAEGNINPAIPRKLRGLVGLDPNWGDGPAAVAGVRNRLVHPRRAAGSVAWPPEVLTDAWRLSSRYLELVLLHALGVRSQIRDRLGSPWVGATVKPPWVP